MKALKYILSGVGVLLLVLLLWGLIEPYFLDVEEEEAAIPGLPAAWEGQRVAQVSDFQVGMWMDNASTVRDAAEAIVEAAPALVLITGDFTYHGIEGEDRERQAVLELLQPLLDSGIPTYAVLGNHDYGMETPEAEAREAYAATLAETLEAAGITVLENEAVPLAPPEGPAPGDTAVLYLVGIGAHWPGEDEPLEAVRDVPVGAPRLVMMHNPESFAPLPPASAPLAVAGHTHGGQVRLPLLEDWSWLTMVKTGEVHADGWITGYGAPGNRLYVNRGIGFGGLPIRINCAPELTLFTLRRGE